MKLDPVQAGFSEERLGRITSHLNEHYIEPGKIAGCQVLVSRGGVPAYFESLGHMDRERGSVTAPDTMFRIYSMSKPITSIALMQLYEQGHFQLNDPIHRFLPQLKNLQVWVSGEGEQMETRPATTPITFRHLLSHSAGFTYGGTNHPIDKAYRALGIGSGNDEYDLDGFIEKLGRLPLRFDPGTAWQYSFATDVCGALVQRIFGQPFDQYLSDKIFEPLGMIDTAFHLSDDKLHRFSANYQRGRDKSLQLLDDPATSKYRRQPTFLSGGGGLISTTADYYRFSEMLRLGGKFEGKRIIGERTLGLMLLNHLPGEQDLSDIAIGAFSETAYDGVGFGLGFAMTMDQIKAGCLGEGDYYWGGAASTIFWVDPVEQMVVIFMTQLMPSGSFNFRGQLKNIIYSAIEAPVAENPNINAMMKS